MTEEERNVLVNAWVDWLLNNADYTNPDIALLMQEVRAEIDAEQFPTPRTFKEATARKITWKFEDYFSDPIVQKRVPKPVSSDAQDPPRTLRDIEILHRPHNGRGVRIKPNSMLSPHTSNYEAYWLDVAGNQHCAELDRDTNVVLLVLQ